MSSMTLALASCSNEDEDGYRADGSVSTFIKDNVEGYDDEDDQLQPEDVKEEYENVKFERFQKDLVQEFKVEKIAKKKAKEEKRRKEKLRKKKEEEQRVLAEKQAEDKAEKGELTQLSESSNESEESDSNGESLGIYVVSAYTAYCDTGCTGVTKSGKDISNTIYSNEGHRIVAADTGLIPLNSIIKVSVNGDSFTAKVLDTGGAIVNKRLDLLVDTKDEAINWGMQEAEVRIIRRGG